ncbi:MAG: amidohydrolase family protein [Burkholderiaceae bacterium]
MVIFCAPKQIDYGKQHLPAAFNFCMALISIPHSAAKLPPRRHAPANACDSHIHILDASLDARISQTQDATVAQYQQLQTLLGTQRVVVVQPRPYGTDHRVMLEAIQRFGMAHARGIGVVHPQVSDTELNKLHAGGIRGIRFSLYTNHQAVVDFDMVEPLAHRVHALGWHLQLHWTADQIAEHAPLLLRLPTTLVFDHFARLPIPNPIQHPAFTVINELLQRGRAWIKLSGAYLCDPHSSQINYANLSELACFWIKFAPNRMVWGSDWPHTTESEQKPNDSQLFDLLHDWSESHEVCQRILVDNPALLYGFI